MEWAEGRGVEFERGRGMKGWGVWWLDEVDVSVMALCQALCHCQCQPHQPIPQWSATVCFKAIVFVATSISVLVLLCCPTFALCPIHLLIGICHLFVACTMSCVCVGFVGVCCVMSSDGVWGVDDAVCVLLSTPKKGSTAHGPVCT